MVSGAACWRGEVPPYIETGDQNEASHSPTKIKIYFGDKKCYFGKI